MKNEIKMAIKNFKHLKKMLKIAKKQKNEYQVFVLSERIKEIEKEVEKLRKISENINKIFELPLGNTNISDSDPRQDPSMSDDW